MTQQRLTRWLPVVVWMAFIFAGSSQQGLPVQPNGALDLLIKKTGHVLEYAILGVLLLRALRGSLAGCRRVLFDRRDAVRSSDSEEIGEHAAVCMAFCAFSRLSDRLLGVPRSIPFMAVVIGCLYAISDEAHQLFVPTRSGNLHDVVLDTAAVTLSVILASLWQRFRSRFLRRS